MKKLRIVQFMIVATILLLVAFQSYYIRKVYNDKWIDLKKETDVLFRESIFKLQVSRFKNDTVFFRKFKNENLFGYEAVNIVSKKLDDDAGAAAGNKKKPLIIELPDNDELIERQKEEFLSVSPAVLPDSMPPGKTLATRKKVRLQIMDEKRYRKESAIITHIDSNVNIAPVKKEYAGKKKIQEIATPKETTDTPAPIRNRQFATFDRLIVGAEQAAPGSSADLQDAIKIVGRDKLLNDSLPVKQIDSMYNLELAKAGIKVPYQIKQGSTETKEKARPMANEFKTNPASVGIVNLYYYQAIFKDPFSFISGKIIPQIILSVLLIAFTVVSFVVLYNNLVNQRRLANIKNDFISNITHELKTPIATVNVAIEAMRNFNAMQDPVRTEEYLDISALELQRLSLLVDKVLRLSMYEKKEIELKMEWFNMAGLVKEVITSMRLQFDKHKATVNLSVLAESPNIHADRLHIMSVVYNLLDNALKYSSANPIIDVELRAEGSKIYLTISDNGIGILPRYHDRIFEKFFRVPSNNTHNIKGYGLGLSYVCHILQQHGGSIKVESEAGAGSRFIIELPK